MSLFYRFFLFTFILFFIQLNADPFPPQVDSNATGAHYAPVAWPAESEWKPYSRFGNDINDARTQDPSNGGTAPQNYVNVASSCADTTQPSVYYFLRQGPTPEEDVIMFRWRVEQIANTYATGPTAGAYSSGDAWNSALWTVLFDIDGDGIRDVAAHLDGSSGSPSEPIDMIFGIYGDIPTQSIDYTADPNIKLIGHNPTAFVGTDDKILNFHNTLAPDVVWSNGSDETVWDYGTTRSSVSVSSPCTEYYIDYQIPAALIDASRFGGPKLTRESPISMIFCTANSLNNPFQKDCAINAEWIADPNKEAPFGDFISFDKNESYTQVIIDDIAAVGCNPVTLTAKVKDAIAIVDGEAVPSIASVDFYVYRDANGDGIANDGDTWTLAAAGEPVDFNTWTAVWQSETLFAGQYLVGVKATDDPSKVDIGMDTNGTTNVTFSYLTQAEVDVLPGKPANETWWANPEITGVKSIGLAVNNCGIAPTLDKSVNNAEPTAGETVTFTLEFSNPPLSPDVITLFQLNDALPAGFIYNGNIGGDLAPFITTQPGVGDTGTISWEINGTNGIQLDANTSRTLTFEVNASSVAGLYNNVANASSSFGEATSNIVPISVGAPLLNIAITADKTLYAAGEPVFYTVTYGNDSSVNTTGTVVEVNLTGLGVSAPSNISNGGTYNAGTGIITWNVGSLLSGSTGNSFTFDINTSNPFNAIDNPIVMPATIDSNETNVQRATATVMVDVPTPNLIIQKDANVSFVTPANNDQVLYTISIANTGTGPATDVNITDVVPAGFTFISAPAGENAAGVNTLGTVKWTIGTLDENASTSVTLILQVDNPNTDTSSTNTASVVGSNVNGSKEDSVTIGIYQTPVGSVGTCYAPTGFTDTSDNVNVLSDINVSDDVRDSYIAFNSSTAFDETIYQEYTFPNTLATVGDTFSDINFTIEYFEKNLDGSKIEIWDGGILINTIILSGHSSTQNQEILESINLLTNGVDTVSELNNLKIRFFAYGNGNNNSRTQATDFVQLCVIKDVIASPLLHLQYQVDKLNATIADTLLYTVTYGNSGSGDANGTTITTTVPAGLENIVPSGTGTYDPGTGVITWNVDILSGDTGTLTFSADIIDSFTGDSLPSTATLAHTPSSTNLSANVLTQLEGIVSGGTPNIIIQKAADKTVLIPGDIVTYSLTILNVGDGTATNLTVTDDIPDKSYFQYITNSATGGDSRAVIAGLNGADSLEWSIASLTSGSSVTLTYQMEVNTTGVPTGLTTLDNNASSVDDNGTSQANTVTVTLNTNPNLTIDKSVSNPNAAPGELVTYTIFVSNIGTGDANSTTITDPIPANLSFEGGITTTQGSGYFDGVGNEVVFELGTLAADANATVTFQARVDSSLAQGSTLITNTANVSASNAAIKSDTATITTTADVDLVVNIYGPSSAAYPTATIDQNATDSTTISVDDASQFWLGELIKVDDVFVTISAMSGNILTLSDPVTVTSGTSTITGSVSYSVFYQNYGSADAVDTNLTLDLGGLTYSSATGTPVENAGSVTWDLGSTVTSGASGNFQIIAFPPSVGSYTLTANISSTDTVDNLEVNNTDTVTTIFGGLKVEKSTSTPTVVQPAGSDTADINYTITIYNTLSTDVSDVNITDTLPAGFNYSATTNVTNSSYVVDDTYPSQPVWAGITVPANGMVIIDFIAQITNTVGAATYQNGVYAVTSEANTSITQYDELASTAEDVTVIDGTDGVIEGYIFEDKNSNGIFDTGDISYANVEVTITDDSNSSFYYTVITDGSGYFSKVVAAGDWTIQHDTTNIGLSLLTGYSNPTSVTVPAGETVLDLNPYVNFISAPAYTVVKTETTGLQASAAGQILSYEINVTNTGNVDLTDINITDTMPDGSTPVLAAPTGDTGSDNILGVGESWIYAINYTISQAEINAGADLVNHVSVTTAEVPGPVEDNATTTVLIQLPVSTDDIYDATTGENVTIDIVNNDSGGTFALDTTTVTLIPPAGVTDVVTDTAGDTIGFTVPGEGTWTVDETTGEVTFSPEDGFVGDPTPIEYTIEDEQGNATTAEISINYPPIANDDSVTAELNEVVTLDVLANDQNTSDPLDPSTVRFIDQNGNETDILYVPNEGTWIVETNGSVTFEPDFNFSGDASINYVVREINGDVSNEATISIQYPSAIAAIDDGVIKITHYGATPIYILDNDTYDGDVSIKILAQPEHGTVEIVEDADGRQMILYTPEPDYNYVPDTFRYSITDANGNVAEATVRLDIQCTSSQRSDSGDALGTLSMLFLAMMTLMIGLHFVRKEEERGEA